jgi:hypothetical protein
MPPAWQRPALAGTRASRLRRPPVLVPLVRRDVHDDADDAARPRPRRRGQSRGGVRRRPEQARLGHGREAPRRNAVVRWRRAHHGGHHDGVLPHHQPGVSWDFHRRISKISRPTSSASAPARPISARWQRPSRAWRRCLHSAHRLATRVGQMPAVAMRDLLYYSGDCNRTRRHLQMAQPTLVWRLLGAPLAPRSSIRIAALRWVGSVASPRQGGPLRRVRRHRRRTRSPAPTTSRFRWISAAHHRVRTPRLQRVIEGDRLAGTRCVAAGA